MRLRSVLLVAAGAVALLALAATPSVGAGASVAVVDDAYRDSSSGSSVTTITAGDTVVWSWAGGNAHQHTVTALSGSFDSDSACGGDKAPCRSPGHTYSRTFTDPGTYQYRCKVHLTMLGTVQVQAPPSDDGGDGGDGRDEPGAPSAPTEPRQESPEDSGSGEDDGSGDGSSSGADGAEGTQADSTDENGSSPSSGSTSSSSSGSDRSYGPRRAYVPGLDFRQGGNEDFEPSVEDPAVAPEREAEPAEPAGSPDVASEASDEPTETESPDEIAIQFPDDPGERRLRRIGAALMAGGLVMAGGITGRRYLGTHHGA